MVSCRWEDNKWEIGMISGKIWGTTQEIFKNNSFEVHRITIKKDGFCSKHKHQAKFNAFLVESGKLEIQVWKNDYVLVDKTILEGQQQTVVKPGESHRFRALEDTIAYEYYWVELRGDDIIRDDVGGVGELQPLKKRLGEIL